MMVCLKLVVRDVFSSIIIEGFRKIKFSGCAIGVVTTASRRRHIVDTAGVVIRA